MPDKGFGKHIESCRKGRRAVCAELLNLLRNLVFTTTYRYHMPYVGPYVGPYVVAYVGLVYCRREGWRSELW
jgi:hypothetical protein